MWNGEVVMSKLSVSEGFFQLMEDLNDQKIELPRKSEDYSLEFSVPSQSGDKLERLENEGKHKFDSDKGIDFLKGKTLFAYDESVNKYKALEGSAFLTCHSLVQMTEKTYKPIPHLTVDFYTKSTDIADASEFIQEPDVNEDIGSKSKKESVKDRNKVILENTKENSIVFIDGPLVGAQTTSLSLKLVEGLRKKGCTPIFFVKNSDSSMVTDYRTDLRKKFNSDIHWANEKLSTGSRTDFYKYIDQENSSNAKVFCYIKPFEASPQRVELPVGVYEENKHQIDDLMGLVYYLMIAHGDEKPQVRTIAIAEDYARSVIDMIDLEKFMETRVTPTMNEDRGLEGGDQPW